MTHEEREFLSDIEDALEDWGFSEEHYHETHFDGRYFCVDVTITDFEEWSANQEEIYEALNEVCEDWDAGMDDDTCQLYEIALKLDD